MSRDMCLLHSVIVGEKSYDRCCIIHMETDTSTAWQHATQHGMLGDGGRVFHSGFSGARSLKCPRDHVSSLGSTIEITR